MFEWDEEKNHRNIAKHGIAFGEVSPVFSSQKALVIEDSRKEYGEARRDRPPDFGPSRQQAGER
jgi:uncharacterized DUF497 family protein